jgi:integrase
VDDWKKVSTGIYYSVSRKCYKARLRYSGKDYEKEVGRLADAKQWRNELKSDLQMAPGGVSFHSRNGWTATYEVEDGVIASATVPHLKAATSWLLQTQQAVEAGTYVDEHLKHLTFSQLASEWSRNSVKAIDSTRLRYNVDLRNHILPAIGDVLVGHISKKVLQSWVTGMMEAGVSNSTIEKAFKLAKQILKYAVQEGTLKVNPAANVSIPQVIRKPQRAFTLEEITALLNELDNDAVPLKFLIATGMRPSEMSALYAKDVVLGETTIVTIERNFTVDLNYKKVLGPTKTKQNRTIPLPKAFVDEIAQLASQREPFEYLFKGERGLNALNMGWYAKARVRPALERAGIKNAHLYTARHTFTSIMITLGKQPVTVISKLLGHSNTQQTLKAYSHTFDEGQMQAIEVFNDILALGTGQERGRENDEAA